MVLSTHFCSRASRAAHFGSRGFPGTLCNVLPNIARDVKMTAVISFTGGAKQDMAEGAVHVLLHG